jgi:uncharacterized MAPEG superfamily protein
VKAPATAGNEVFERYYRVQMNTVELLILFLPSMWLCGRYWSPYLAAIGGVVYLAGRMIYLNAYVKDPASRSLGFGLSMVPILVFLLADVAGAVRILILTHGS